jgi:hypothetical protein
MFTTFREKHPELTGVGTKWTALEEQQLVHELDISMNISTIAQHHNRTEGGIRARITDMIYRDHVQGNPKEETMKVLHVTEEQYNDIISSKTTTRDNRQKKREKKEQKEQKEQNTPVMISPLRVAPPLEHEFTLVKTELAELKTEMTTIKTEVLSLKKMLKHITLLMESVVES